MGALTSVCNQKTFKSRVVCNTETQVYDLQENSSYSLLIWCACLPVRVDAMHDFQEVLIQPSDLVSDQKATCQLVLIYMRLAFHCTVV